MSSAYYERGDFLEEVARSLCELIQGDVRRLGSYSCDSWGALLDALQQVERAGAERMRKRAAQCAWVQVENHGIAPTLVREAIAAAIRSLEYKL